MMSKFQELFLKNTPKPEFEGEWFTVSWQPDLGSDECLNIGVGLTVEGKTHVRMLDNFDRLKCLFSDDAEFHVRLLASMVDEAVKAGDTELPSPQIRFQKKGFSQGYDLSDTLGLLYERAVTLGRPKTPPNKREFKTISRDTVYHNVVKKLKQMAQLDYENLIQEQETARVEGRNLYLPFRSRSTGFVGSLASAVYASPDSVKINLLEASRDLNDAANTISSRYSCLFIREPDERDLAKLPQARVDLIEDYLDRAKWSAKNSNIHIGSGPSDDILAEEVYRLAKIAKVESQLH